MPLMMTNSIGSTKGFGFTRGKSKLLTQYTFPSGTSTWTAPSGVTSLTSAQGKGSNGTSEQQAVFDSSVNFPTGIPTYSGANCFGTNVGSSYTTDRSSRITTFNSELSAVSSSSWVSLSFTAGFYMYCSDKASYLRYISTTSTSVKKVSGVVYYLLSAASAGTATTGFGLTFPGGGVGQSATITSFSDISVIPGNTYTIKNNGSLTISYYI